MIVVPSKDIFQNTIIDAFKYYNNDIANLINTLG